MPYKAKGKCVYKKDTGKKVGCTKGSVSKYLKALRMHAEGYRIVCESLQFPNLSKYERMYDKFDEGHSQEHMSRVRDMAVILAKKYAPDKIRLAYIAATLHDIGLSKGREDHEKNGALMILKDPYLKKIMSPEEIKEVSLAVGQHRASTGKPITAFDKIISDADRSATTTSYSMYRAIMFGLAHNPGTSLEWNIERAIDHLSVKYHPNGPGRRHYYPESGKRLSQIFDPIVSLKNDKEKIKKGWNLLSNIHKARIKRKFK